MKVIECCKYAPKSSIKAGEAVSDGKYMFFTSSSDESKRLDSYLFDGEGIIMGTGGNATLHYYKGKYSVSTDCVVLIPDERLECKYLYYFFRANMDVLERGFKGAGLRHTNKQYIGDIELGEIPTIERQKEVISIMDKVVDVMNLGNEQIIDLDNLIKSRFVEMFGDPISNPMNWKQMTFRQAGVRLSDGPFGSNLKSEHYTDEGVRVIRLGNIGVGKFIDDDKSFVSNSHYETIKKYTCRAGDIVIGTLGEPNLRACILPENIKFAINKADCVHYIPKGELLNNCFVCQYINCPETLLLASRMIHGQTRARISSGQIAELPIYVPPIELQNQFADFVSSVDKLKVELQKTVDETQILFDSLMQQYFG